MSQLSFSDAKYLGKRKRTRREVFLSQMEQVVPWLMLFGLIEAHYPKAGRGVVRMCWRRCCASICCSSGMD